MLFHSLCNCYKSPLKKFTLLGLIFMWVGSAQGQITKGNWLVGGTGNFTIFKFEEGNRSYFEVSPRIGYFLLDNFAAGLMPSYAYTKNITNKESEYDLGPFARYYFLNSEMPFNILIEGTYQYGIERFKSGNQVQRYYRNNFSFSAGPVIYFNSIVGLEFLFGYEHSKYTIENSGQSKFKLGIGLQVHLEKE